MKPVSLVDIIRKAFDEKATRNLKDLFIIVKTNENYSHLTSSDIKHKIRRCIFSLKENHKIRKIGDSTYKKI